MLEKVGINNKDCNRKQPGRKSTSRKTSPNMGGYVFRNVGVEESGVE